MIVFPCGKCVQQDYNNLFDKNLVEIYFQPILDECLNIVCFEQLMRVKCGCGRVFSPDYFKPLLSDSDLHKKVTTLCIDSAEVFIKKYTGKYSVSINISQIDINNRVFLDRLKDISRKKPRFPQNIIFEISERMKVNKNIVSKIKRLIDYGFKFSLDDFFSEHSTLLPVVDIDLYGIKIDKGMLQNFSSNLKTRSLIEAIIYYCNRMQIYCYAEGVETISAFYELKGMGVRRFQGFFCSPAVSLDELDHLIESWTVQHK
ncbi:EAL domain-containing protein [Acetobacter fabarum]|uniref:EAL domain-containing protein n=1 Tax=Acetobacter TaxID=434 RepID=UPI00046FD793|nr:MULTISPECIES: EAL domain-containing protein [Acetobacter]NHO43147.1 EAL domain-containing protein [Acetobacter fabarum]